MKNLTSNELSMVSGGTYQCQIVDINDNSKVIATMPLLFSQNGNEEQKAQIEAYVKDFVTYYALAGGDKINVAGLFQIRCGDQPAQTCIGENCKR